LRRLSETPSELLDLVLLMREMLLGKIGGADEIAPIICGVLTALQQLALKWLILGAASRRRTITKGRHFAADPSRQ
jgi:hypothetical protein